MKWQITFPFRETLRYECESGVYDFEMSWGRETPVLFINGNTFHRADGKKVSVGDQEMELFLTRLREHCDTTGSAVTISRSRDDSDYLPSNYK